MRFVSSALLFLVLVSNGVSQSADTIQDAGLSSSPKYDATGVWTVQFGDSTGNGTLTLDLKESASGHISGTYKSSAGMLGIVDGTHNGDTLEFRLAQTSAECPGTYAGTIHLNDANSGSGQFSGKDCAGQHDNGVALMNRGDAPSATGPAPAQPAANPAQQVVSSEVTVERQKMASECANCVGIMIAYVDAATGSVTYDWATKHQIEWAHKQGEEAKQGKAEARFLFVKNRENAQYVIYWTHAVGYRPYVMYIPHTTTDTGSFNGSYNSYSTNGTNTYGNFDGTVNVTRTEYQRLEGRRSFVNVTATVYDWKGKKLYQTFHQGNWRWSKPDKDCLSDAIEYLRKNVLEATK